MKKTLLFILVITGINLNAQFYVEGNTIATIEAGANMYVQGSANLYNNSTLVNEGTLHMIKEAGWQADFTDNTKIPYNYGNGLTIFVGNGQQNVSTLNNFGTVEVDDAGLNLLTDVNSNNWYLKKGIVNTGNNFAIVKSIAPNAVKNDATNPDYMVSWFNNNLRRYIDKSVINNYIFPVGNSLHPNMAEMYTQPLSVHYINVSFNLKQGTDAGLNATENGTLYTSVNNGGVWDITPDILPINGSYDLKLYFEGFIGLQDNKFGILERPAGSISGVDWVIPSAATLPPINSPGRMVADNYTRRNNLSTFGQMGIGMTDNILPLDLLSFKGKKENNKSALQWITSNEVNVSHFELYRNGQFLSKTLAKNQDKNTYAFVDNNPLPSNQYQLKMVDKDNGFKWSNIVAINFDKKTDIKIYGNKIVINGTVKQVRVLSVDGKEILRSSNNNVITLPNNIAKGIYVVQILMGNGEIIDTKILK